MPQDTAGGPPGQRIGFAPKSLDLGQVNPGELAAANLKISNFGFSELDILQVSPNLPEFSTFFTGGLATVPPFGFIELPVRFSSSQAGIFSGELSIESNDANLPEARVPVLGRSGLALKLAPARLDFGVVPLGGEKILKLKLTNREATSLTLTTVGSTSAAFIPQASFSLLAPGETGTVEIRFVPGRAGEVRDEVLTIGFDAPDEKVVVMTMSATAE